MKESAPHPVADDCQVLTALIFLPREGSPYHWRNAEHREGIGSKPRCIYLCWFPGAGKFEAGLLICAQSGEDTRVSRIYEGGWSCHTGCPTAEIHTFGKVAQRYQAVRIRKRQWP